MSMTAEATLTILSAIAASRRCNDGLRMVADDDNQAPVFPKVSLGEEPFADMTGGQAPNQILTLLEAARGSDQN
jgi:hypothetical protein